MERNEDRSSFEKVYQLVKKAIDQWNPYCLLPDAPEDEFDKESYKIAHVIWFANFILTEDFIAQEIGRIFLEAFDDTFSLEDCKKPAKQIIKFLEELK